MLGSAGQSRRSWRRGGGVHNGAEGGEGKGVEGQRLVLRKETG